MLTAIINALRAVPPEVATVILAMIPIGELRGALPVALTVYKLPLAEAMFLAIAGNMLPVYFLLVFFEKIAEWSRVHSRTADRFFDYLFARTRVKLQGNVTKYGVWALALFVAIPLPVTGAWTGTLAAFVFGLPRARSFWAIFVGVCISAVIVLVVTAGTVFTIRGIWGNNF
ncbi:MAG: small multi-drug export protein [Candidatus Andersenbacteria bacterium]|nr:small multi-drug export protein [bacterium]MDZ4225615.1 small multi-drug export protein [Candidatus Andersenbacteria bacterium]